MNALQHFGLFALDADGGHRPATAAEILAAARAALDAHVVRHGAFSAPCDAKTFAAVRLGQLGHEVFAVIFLDAQMQVIDYREMFRGTLSQTSVHPREVAKEALQLNASAVILAHNHPSGVPTPSEADKRLTRVLKDVLALVDVRVLDHLVVGGGRVVSFAEVGLI